MRTRAVCSRHVFETLRTGDTLGKRFGQIDVASIDDGADFFVIAS